MIIHYDGDCPFCARYVGLVRLRAAAGPVSLVNLRDAPAALARFKAQGLNPDDGMIVETAGRLYHGADAMNAISLMSSRSGILNRIAAAIFSNALLARLLYPWLRAGRNAALFFMGRSGFGTSSPGEAALYAMFARMLGLFTVLDFMIYYLRYQPLQMQPTMPVLLGLGLGLMFRPEWRPGFVLTIIIGLIDFWLHAPMLSNHTIMRAFLGLAIVLGGAWHMLAGSSWQRFFQDVRPVGRALLLVMYVFGVFHKINADFLNPAVSCAVLLWQKMPAPLAALDSPLMRELAIYGTFASEGLVFLLLLIPRGRPLGIVLGIGFHALLALSNHDFYAPYSTLAVMLHLLFLSPDAALAITASRPWQLFDALFRRPLGAAIVVALFSTIALAALFKDFSAAGLVWLAFLVLPLFAIFRYGGAIGGEPPKAWLLWSRLVPLNAIGLLFFINCLSPYLGLKSAQAINMFSNLRIEAGINNHLILSGPPGPFHYLDRVVTIDSATGQPYLASLAATKDLGLVPYQFKAILAKSPGARVGYTLNGVAHAPAPAAEIIAREGGLEHPAWVRKLFHFRPVPLSSPINAPVICGSI